MEFREHEKDAMLHDLNEMVAWVEQLGELIIEENDLFLEQFVLLQGNNLRQDVAINSLSHEQALMLAPNSDSNYFRTPSVKA
ncbi:Asp-tRNA(Asn)/Glu-tRNA(Gln) amidotransferase subunit GatC [Cardinium endosymbiont of Tipula unca]|uniref:Asp-tRNA(Asn)/Glu-tRNA(Gln) amidotransferase subunit GatC n=1 Tax=Cardinium endosymbiont of Tipula unca TaxID=3066216 RepID=UPI0030D54A13